MLLHCYWCNYSGIIVSWSLILHGWQTPVTPIHHTIIISLSSVIKDVVVIIILSSHITAVIIIFSQNLVLISNHIRQTNINKYPNCDDNSISTLDTINYERKSTLPPSHLVSCDSISVTRRWWGIIKDHVQWETKTVPNEWSGAKCSNIRVPVTGSLLSSNQICSSGWLRRHWNSLCWHWGVSWSHRSSQHPQQSRWKVVFVKPKLKSNSEVFEIWLTLNLTNFNQFLYGNWW